MNMLGPSEMIIILMITLQLVFLTVLPLLAWVYMYRKGTETRDMIFWGVIALFVPLLGPIVVILYTRRRDKAKANPTYPYSNSRCARW